MLCLHQTQGLTGLPKGPQDHTPAEKETNLPEALQGLVDHHCPGHPVSKKEAGIVRSAHVSASLPTPTHTETVGYTVTGCPRAEPEAGTVELWTAQHPSTVAA